MAIDKFQKAEGILHSTPIKSGKKKDGGDYSIQQLVLELDGSYTGGGGKYHENTYLMLFDTSKGVVGTIDNFSSGDPVKLTYVMKGRSYKKKDGTMGYDNAMMCIGIEHADLDSQHSRPGTVKAQPAPVEEEPFNPLTDGEDENDLPF